MLPRLRAVLITGLVFGVLTACFSEPAPQPGFRFSCAGDGDCEGAEACIGELCQVPCSSTTEAEACENGSLCFNGVCADLCNTDDAHCSAPNECIAPSAEELAAAEAAGVSLGFPPGMGVCGELCETTADCPGEEICEQGMCIDLSDLGGTAGP